MIKNVVTVLVSALWDLKAKAVENHMPDFSTTDWLSVITEIDNEWESYRENV